jgi:hypothetical protein
MKPGYRLKFEIGCQLLLGVLLLLLAGCEQKVKTGEPPSQAQKLPMAQAPLSPGMPSDIAPIRGDSPTVVPEGVRGKWKAVKLLVDDKTSRVSQEYVVNLREQLVIPNSKLLIKVNEFLPDLKIEGSTFTSDTNELKNPAVHVSIFEDGKLIFNGWLFSMFPTIHPFQHNQYRVLLKEALATD